MSGNPVLRLVCLAANMRCLKGAVGGAGNLTHPNTPAHTDTDTQKKLVIRLKEKGNNDVLQVAL
jgi:hypothetical protein